MTQQVEIDKVQSSEIESLTQRLFDYQEKSEEEKTNNLRKIKKEFIISYAIGGTGAFIGIVSLLINFFF